MARPATTLPAIARPAITLAGIARPATILAAARLSAATPETLGAPALEDVVGVEDLLTIDFFVTAMVVTLALKFCLPALSIAFPMPKREEICSEQISYFPAFSN
jgi:hypothetical protein